MKQRVLAGLLWFYAGWYLGALVADSLGVSQALGPIIGAAAAALIAGDPRGVIWAKRGPRLRDPEVPATVADDLAEAA